MKAFAFLLVLIVSLLYISPFYSMYQIGNSIKSDDKETLNLYTSWPELQASVKEDLELFLKNREELRKKEVEGPIGGAIEDLKKFSELLFGEKAINVAVKKVINPDSIIKLAKISSSKTPNSEEEVSQSTDADSQIFSYDGYSLESFNLISISDFEALVLTPEGDIYFKMRFTFPRWVLYTVKSQKLTEVIAKKVEESVDLVRKIRKILPSN
ncbi:DUF2939 domain-containing protein [bacterium]|jgi:hypothetical protein|nr:DUF2939 domain-containing protein [bacterium]|tara:strand:- start:9212 stop:9847 length:636 start_codon:yes stop_codon:yes gene_type:complete